jgi:hypothetical protein
MVRGSARSGAFGEGTCKPEVQESLEKSFAAGFGMIIAVIELSLYID